MEIAISMIIGIVTRRKKLTLNYHNAEINEAMKQKEKVKEIIHILIGSVLFHLLAFRKDMIL